MASHAAPPRGRRPWHVGQSEYVATREILCFLALKRVCRTTDNKGRKANGAEEVGWRRSTGEGG